ncbi:MAG: AMP-binding protein [Ruminococcus sp.]|nr:AMP-binding protein [Ruminococcus sp.]
MKWDGVREHCDKWRCITYGVLLGELAEKYGDKTAVVCEDERISYSELDTMSDSLLAYFLSLGLKKGDIVVLQVPNSLELAVTLFALFKGGIIPVMTLPAHGRYEISGICRLSSPKAYICMDTECHSGCIAVAESVAEENACIRHMITGKDIRRQAELGNVPADYEKPDYTDIALLLLSGGTTGIPKMIPRTHGDYIYDNTVIGERCLLGSDSVFLAVLPASHNFTLGNPGMLGTLMYGGRVVMSDSVSPMEIFGCIEAERATYTAMVPSVLGMCIDYRRDDDSDDISSLSFVMTGGAMLPKETEECAEEVLGCKLLQIYGTAEGLNTCYSPTDELRPDSGRQGIPISPYDEILILGADGEPLPNGQAGEMVTRGPYTITGYYNNPEANAESFTPDGYYRTGDLAVLNGRGELTLLGRAVEQINKGGEKIMPSELENNIRKYDKVADCSVAGIPDKELGSAIAAFIVPLDEEVGLRELRDFLRESGVAAYKLPDIVVNVKSFPLTAVNKVDKKRLVREYAGERR